MKILALENETREETLSPRLLTAEAQRVWELFSQGIIREAYFRSEVREAVLILEAADAPSAKEILDTLPLVESGHLSFEVIPLVPYDGFRRLFSRVKSPAYKPGM